MRLGRKLATGVVAETTEDTVQEQTIEAAAASAEDVRSELSHELPKPVPAS